jgi:hypothetical protein
VHGRGVEMRHDAAADPASLGEGRTRFVGEFPVNHSGRNGFSVRLLPRDDRMATPFATGLISWDTESDPNLPSTRQITDFTPHNQHSHPG